MNMEIMQCYAKPSDFPEMKRKRKKKKHKRGQELSNTNANLQYNFPEEISSLKETPLEPLSNTGNGVVPVEVKDIERVPPVNISTDVIWTSEKKKKRKKPRWRSKNPKTINTDDLSNTGNGAVPVEVKDIEKVPPVNISTDMVLTSEKKKKRKKPSWRSKNPKTFSTDDDNFKSLENTTDERNPCLKSSAGVDGTINSWHLASFEDIFLKEKTITTNNDCFESFSLENAPAERSPCFKSFASNDGKIDSQHLASFKDTLSENNSCLESLVCNDGTTNLEHNTVTAYLACSGKKKKRKKKRKRSNDSDLLEVVSLVKNSLQKDSECVKTSVKRSEGMESEGGKSCPLLGSVAVKGKQVLNTEYSSSENRGMDHAMLISVVSSPGAVGVDSLSADASLGSTEIKKKSLGQGLVDVNNGENISRDSPMETAVLDSTDIKENSPSPQMAETCKKKKIIENGFKSSNSENSFHPFKESIGDTSHFPDETNTCHLLTANLSCSRRKKKKKKKKKEFVPCENNNKFCDRLQGTTSTDNILTDHDKPLKPPVKITTNMELKEENYHTKSISSLEKGEDELHKKRNALQNQQMNYLMQDNSCVVGQDLIDAHISDKVCQDYCLEVTVFDSADNINKYVGPDFADVKSLEKDCGVSLLDVADLDSNDIKENMVNSGVEFFKHFVDDCKDSNFHIELLNTIGLKEKSLTSGEPSSFLDRTKTGSLENYGDNAEVNVTLLESRDTKTSRRRKRARKSRKLSNMENSSHSYEDSTGGTSRHHLDTMYTDDLAKSKLESKCSGLHAITEKICQDNLNKKAESNCSGDGNTSEEKKEGMQISLADNSCTQNYLKNSSSKLDVSEGNLEKELGAKLGRIYITKHKSNLIDDGLSYIDKSFNACSLSDPLCGSSKSNSVQIETKMDVAPPSSHSGAVKDDPDLDAVAKVGNSRIFNPSPERYLVDDSRKKLLILDINGLLVDFVNPIPKGCRHDKVISKKAVFKRPYCDEFLQFCFDRFNVGVWSSRTKKNVDTVVEFLMSDSKHKLLFCWDQSHCTDTGYRTIENKEKPLFLKELRKLWEKCDPDLPWEKGEFNETNTLLLDDSPYKAILNPAYTAIFPKSFTYRRVYDSSLGPEGDLRIYLEDLANTKNVQKYVEQNPFGQRAITESSPSWNFYKMIMNV